MTDANSQPSESKITLLEKATNQFHETLLGHFNEIEASWQLAKANPGDYALLRTFKRLLQSMSDRCGVFSVPKVKALALEIEKVLSYPLWIAGESASLPVEKIDDHLGKMGIACRGQIAHYDQTPFTAEEQGWRAQNRSDELLIVVVEEDVEFVNGVSKQLKKADLRVKNIQTIEEMTVILNTMEPATIIVNCELAMKSPVPFETLVSQCGRVPPPIIMISDNDTMQNRLETLRSGASFFLPKIAGPERIVMALNSVLETRKDGKLKVMVVGESRPLAEYLAMVFHNIGARVGICVNPLELLPPMRRFRPDVILIDMRMTLCSGFEMTRIIRQELGFAQTPIMFLSSDPVDINLSYERNLDITNFIPLPQSQVRLVRAVLNAIKISKKKITNANTDAMSGHLNQEAFLEKIEEELVRSKRTKHNFCVALVELDSEGSGMSKGGYSEEAIKALSDVLRTVLRSSDDIGRLEEGTFGILLIETDSGGGTVAMEKIRGQWKKKQEENEHLSVHKSISAGLSMYPAYNQSKALLRGAQAALDSAKLGGGGNTVVAAK